MAKGIDKAAVVPVEATLLSIAIVLTSLRLFLRLVLQRTRLTVSDWFLVASILDGIALFVTDTMAYKLGGMDDYDAPPRSTADQIALMKVEFAGNYFYDTGVYFPKLALLAFYYRLIPPTMPKLRKVLYFATGMTVCFALTTCFVDTFWCGSHVAVNWDLDGTCSSYESMTITQIDWALNLTSDLFIFSIPFPILRGLQVNKRHLIGLIATFCSGIITVACSVSRFATMQVIHAWTNVYVLSMTELVAAIVVVCLPALKSLIHTVEVSTSKRDASNSNPSYNPRGYSKYGTATSHMKLSSGRDPHTTSIAAAGGDDSGSEVELNRMHRQDVIYKSERISVTLTRRPDLD